MKEIALLGTTNQVTANILSVLLQRNISVTAMVDYPTKVMVENTLLTVTHLPVEHGQQVTEMLEGFHDAVLAYNDDLHDAYTNDLTLKYFAQTVVAAAHAGIKRLIVVGAKDSEAFFVSELRRIDDIDWVFISTEGDYAHRTADEIEHPTYHREIFA